MKLSLSAAITLECVWLQASYNKDQSNEIMSRNYNLTWTVYKQVNWEYWPLSVLTLSIKLMKFITTVNLFNR